jgi:pilus assembly protein CpaF
MGSGKTTLLNTLVKSLPEPMRVVTLERHADLIMKRPMSARLNARSQQEMLQMIGMAEHMRADYIVLSETRGSEVMPFIDFVRNNCSCMAATTGNDVVDAIKRLETKALISSEGMSLEDVRYAISQAFHIIVFQERLHDGKRKVTNISAIEYQSGELKLKNLYK